MRGAKKNPLNGDEHMIEEKTMSGEEEGTRTPTPRGTTTSK